MNKYLKHILLLIITFNWFHAESQNRDSNIDSLILLISKSLPDSARVDLYNETAFLYYSSSPDTTFLYADSAYVLTKQIKYVKGEIQSLKMKGVSYFVKSDFQKALEYYIKALEIAEKVGDKPNMISLYSNIGLIYSKLNSFTDALNYMLKASDIIGIDDKSKRNASVLLNIGAVYDKIDSIDLALKYYNKAYEINKNLNDEAGVAKCSNNIAYILYRKGEYNLSLPHFLRAEKILEKSNDLYTLSTVYINIARVYSQLNINYKALHYFDKAMNAAVKSQSIEMEMEVYNDLFQFYEKNKNFEKAFINHKKFFELKDSIYTEEAANSIKEIQTKYETEKKDQENILLRTNEAKKNAELRQQKYFNILIIAALFFTLLILILLMRTGLQRKKANVELEYKNQQINQQKEEIVAQNESLEQQKEEIQAQNNDLFKKNLIIEKVNKEINIQKEKVEIINANMISSINYALNIQNAMLPSLETIKEAFQETFLFFKPRDIVSGDFYFYKEIDNFKIFALADCTGHGVPGAFVSMLGISLLNEIVMRDEVKKASDVLEILRQNLINSLNQSHSEYKSKDGMDIAFCVFNKNTMNLQFSGANNSLYILRNENNKFALEEYKPDKQPVGVYVKPKEFTNHDIQLKTGDIIYMFSDGYADQFGGKHNQKFKINRFRELILSIQGQSLYEQKKIIVENYYNWKADSPQIDDVLVWAIKI